MDALTMLSPVAGVRCGCGCWFWAVGDPLLDCCHCCGREHTGYPLYAQAWNDVRPGG